MGVSFRVCHHLSAPVSPSVITCQNDLRLGHESIKIMGVAMSRSSLWTFPCEGFAASQWWFGKITIYGQPWLNGGSEHIKGISKSGLGVFPSQNDQTGLVPSKSPFFQWRKHTHTQVRKVETNRHIIWAQIQTYSCLWPHLDVHRSRG